MVHKVGEIRMSTDGKMVVRLLGAKFENGRYNDNLNIKLLVEIANALNVDFDMMLEFNNFERRLWDKST